MSNEETKPIPGAHENANPECAACGGLGWVLEDGEPSDTNRRFVACACTDRAKSGEVVLGLLVGLALGIAALVITSGNEAQTRANLTGSEVSQVDVIADQPGKSALIVLGPAVAGAGVGWALDQMSGDGDNASRDNSIRIDGNEGNISVNIRGDGGDSSSTSTRTDTRTEGSNNQ